MFTCAHRTGSAAGCGEPTLTYSGYISFVCVMANTIGGTSVDKLDSDVFLATPTFPIVYTKNPYAPTAVTMTPTTTITPTSTSMPTTAAAIAATTSVPSPSSLPSTSIPSSSPASPSPPAAAPSSSSMPTAPTTASPTTNSASSVAPPNSVSPSSQPTPTSAATPTPTPTPTKLVGSSSNDSRFNLLGEFAVIIFSLFVTIFVF